MSAPRNRWEFVEPFMVAEALRSSAAFMSASTTCAPHEILSAQSTRMRFEEMSIARAVRNMRIPDVGTQSIHSVIREAGVRWLVEDGPAWSLRVEPSMPGHEILRWRSATMLMPPSIVVAGALADTGRVRPCRISALSTSIAPHSEVAHLHVHLGPMLPFESLWMGLWQTFVARGTLDCRVGGGIEGIKDDVVPEIGRDGARSKDSGKKWKWLLEVAFKARLWLQAQDQRRGAARSGAGAALPKPSSVMKLANGLVDHHSRPSALLAFWAADEFRGLARREAREFVRRRESEERRMQAAASARSRGSVPPAEPAGWEPTPADDEVVFMARALRRCARGEASETYERTLYQYMRVKVALYGSLVVDPWSSGLRHFLDVVQRDAPYTAVIDDRAGLERMRLRSGQEERPLNVKALEIHLNPQSWLKRSRRAAGSLPQANTWILSFPRAPKTAAPRPLSHGGDADPEGSRAASGWRRAMFAAGTTCRVIGRCLATRPSLLREVRGISLMDWERSGPVWLFERAFESLIKESARIASAHPSLKLRPLRTALHLGEDFDHVLTGLRQIMEPLESGVVRPGDRIGHALALGVSPQKWTEDHAWIRMRPWDRILDLGFGYWAFHALGMSLPADQVERMRAEADHAIASVFGAQGRDPLQTARSVWLSLPRSRSGAVEEEPGADGHRLREMMLDDPQRSKKALSLSLTVETKHELPLIQAVHDVVRDRVTRTRVAIEVNPSSNLLIGGFRSIFEQPAFHNNEIPVTINADDPLTFATSLADDYAYAWAGMVLGSNEPPHQASHRLEEAARCSMRFVFSSDN